MKEHASPEYPPRTKANVDDSDFVLWLGPTGSAGYRCTMRFANAKAARNGGRNCGVVQIIRLDVDRASIRAFATGVRTMFSSDPDHVGVINVAGNRESSNPGVGERAEAFLTALFKELTKG